ncbi:PREDICTED: staphylococcal nuclease [Prunus dulcis]|uniref:PREDICTED: staphylococcal nuclease n=1 Tax=Prunus dulcis TaxID=3755 RepID=A0A5E4E5V2_PRUDU|nr:hypothetical protein L3X38_039693 [Prunus dulcis]VVA10140.1 PREDICTED: staphylococcal nuclease [Prunus dulcis]
MKYSHATVKDVRSGFCLVLLAKDKQLKVQPEKTFFLSWVSAPILGEGDDFEGDEPFAWGSREFMRKLCIGKDVEYYVANTKTQGEYGAVKLEGEDVAQSAISQGWLQFSFLAVNR